MLDPIFIARLEERRQAFGVAEIAAHAQHIMGGTMSATDPGSWTNQACGLGLEGPVSIADVDRLIDFYVSRQLEPRVELAPSADPSLIAALADRGFTLINFDHVLARTIEPDEHLWSLLPNPKPDQLSIRPIDPSSAAEIEQWVRISGSGFISPESAHYPSFFESSRRVAVHPRFTAMLAFWQGTPAGACALEIAQPLEGHTLASLMATSVLPDFRRRGIQQAMIVARLERAQKIGAPLATIQSRPHVATDRNARRLGFHTAYTKVILVLRRPGLAQSM